MRGASAELKEARVFPSRPPRSWKTPTGLTRVWQEAPKGKSEGFSTVTQWDF